MCYLNIKLEIYGIICRDIYRILYSIENRMTRRTCTFHRDKVIIGLSCICLYRIQAIKKIPTEQGNRKKGE